MTKKNNIKKKIISHLKKDDKEFRSQIADDVKMKKMLKGVEIEKESKEKKKR